MTAGGVGEVMAIIAPFYDIERCVEFGLGDGQRWAQRQHVTTTDLEAEAIRQTAIHYRFGQCRIGDLYTERNTQPTDGSDRGILCLHCAQSLQSTRAHLTRSIQQFFISDHIQCREGSRAADRAFLVGVMTQRTIGRCIQIFTCDQRCHRENTAAEAFAQHQHVGHTTHLLAREHRAGAAETTGDFVEDQQGTMPIAACTHARPEIRGRGLQSGPAYRFGDDRADIALHLQHIVDVIGQSLVRAIVVTEKPRRQCRRRNVFGARQQRSRIASEDCLATDRDRIQRCTMERIPHRQRLVPARRVTRQFQRHADRRGAAWCEQHLVQLAGRQFGQPSREFDRCAVGVAARRKWQCRQLSCRSLDHPGMAVANLVHGVAVEIHDSPASGVNEIDALCSLHHIQTRRR